MTVVPPPPSVPDELPIMDRRTNPDRRSGQDRRAGRKDRAEERRSGQDRRQGSRPARSLNQYDMSPDVLEFVNAVNRFRESSGNRFPSAGDILQILEDLGYEKRA